MATHPCCSPSIGWVPCGEDLSHKVSNWKYGADPGKATPWNIDESGEMSPEGKAIAAPEGRMPGAALYKNGASKVGDTARVVADDELEIMPRNQVAGLRSSGCTSTQ
jgi:hypothetical protein